MPLLEAHFVWKVDTEKPSYLFGTIHSSDPAVSHLPPEVVEALRTSASFHPEIEFSPENIGLLTAAIFADLSGNLEEDLPPELWNRLLEHGRGAGLPDFLLRRLPVRLAPLVFINPPDTDFNRIVDIQAYQQAKDNRLAIHPLETIEEQVGIFRKLTRDQAVSFLEEVLDEREAGFPSHAEIIRLYAARDIDRLHAFIEKDLARSDLPDFAQGLLVDRNVRMAERLQAFLPQGGAFVAVGAAHMPGEQGIVALLEKAGFAVSRIPLTDAPERK